ncbi:NUDIX domain-containing protein [Colletotrichum salicis]|uniref:NAD(+) diphosphatase n=1 Tax=Colletotrichum salicis TaxID=1209931 RepID=A0A135U0A5_9PEZI|nr:NUDIX domain-containing protein [Colletotrichum salicis]
MAPPNTAIVLVDPYNDFLHYEGKIYPSGKESLEATGTNANLRTLVAAACNHLTSSHKGFGAARGFEEGSWGAEILEGLEPDVVDNGDVIASRHGNNSGFANTDLNYQLRQRGVTHLVLAGMVANTCLESTTRDARELGFHVTLLTDATAGFATAGKDAATHLIWPLIMENVTTVGDWNLGMGSQTWNLPAPVDDPDSMLSRKFGRETVNYFAGSVLNRVGWLRTDHTFIRAAFQSKDTKFMLLKDLSPLTSAPTRVQFVSYDDVKPLTTEDPFGPSEEDLIKNFDSTVTKPLIIFLGLEESAKVPFEYKGLKGRPWFAVDVTPKGSYADAANQLIEAQSSKGYKFLEGMRPMTLEPDHAGIYAQARSIADWNTRNKFCAGCGQPSLSGNTGYKRFCPTTDLAGSDTPRERAECATRKGVSNISFPRTDPTMIAAVISSDGTKVLLGRNKRYPPSLYSTLAGFIEPGESIEESVRREVFEEAGVRVGRVVIHSSQPWPYPASLMIGAIAQSLPDGETIDLGNDPELEDAQWFPLETVRDALEFGVSGLGEPAPEGYKEGELRLPPPAAIANRLMTAVVEGYATAAPKM